MILAKSNNKNYCTQISNTTASINADVTKNKGGGGEYFQPYDLLCAGFASCLNITIRMVLDKMNLQYDNVITKVDLDEGIENKTVFMYHAEIIGDIDDETKEKVISKSLRCPVRKALSKNIEFQPLGN